MGDGSNQPKTHLQATKTVQTSGPWFICKDSSFFVLRELSELLLLFLELQIKLLHPFFKKPSSP